VEEEDTHRVLGAYHDVTEPRQSTRKLVTEMLNDKPSFPGQVIVTGKYPKRLLAIVHDLEQEPSWRVEWVNEALQEVFEIVNREGFRSIAVPILGGVHGRISAVRFMKMIRCCLDRGVPPTLEQLWLILPPGENCRILQPLKDPQVVSD